VRIWDPRVEDTGHGRMEPPASDMDGGQGRRPTHLRNMVWPSIEGSQERRDTSLRERGNAPRRDADSYTSGDKDDHDDRDNY
jgi:hypothetical protein